MDEVLRFRVEKLIRDKLPEVMRASGLRLVERQLDAGAYREALKAKLAEETAEVAAASSADMLLGELADVMEVVAALAAAHGFGAAELEARRSAKREDRGGFEAAVYIETVEADVGCPALSHYIGKFPQI